MTDIIIRRAEISDIEAMSKVVADSWRTAYKKLISEEDMKLFTNPVRREELFKKRLAAGDLIFELLLNGEVIGVCSVQRYENADFPDTAEIDQLYLSPSAIGKGFGGRLLTYTLDTLRSHGCKQAVLFVMEGNDSAIGFYKHFGFNPDGFYLICENLSRKNRAVRYVMQL